MIERGHHLDAIGRELIQHWTCADNAQNALQRHCSRRNAVQSIQRSLCMTLYWFDVRIGCKTYLTTIVKDWHVGIVGRWQRREQCLVHIPIVIIGLS
jgi:hypothetical protein